MSVNRGLQLQQPQLWTKLIPPQPRANPIPRTRVLEKLNQALDCKLTVVSAQAGMGKTTAVSEWAASLECAFGWVTLDSTDNDPAVFWAYIVSSFSQHLQNLESIVASLQGIQTRPIRSLLTEFMATFSQLQQPFVLVLDDYHVIELQEIHRLMDWFLKYLPPSVHVVIVSREIPTLELAQLRVSEQLLELGNIDLGLDQQDTLLFFEKSFQITLSEARVDELLRLTNGWVAGLQLLGLAVPDQLEAGVLSQQLQIHRYFLDYFASKVLAQMPSGVAEFLIRTSIVDRLCADLCEQLTSQVKSQATLEFLEHQNCFITALDANRNWYSYHPLFREFLRQEFAKRLPSSERTQLYSIAAAWFQQRGDQGQAIEHALAAEDWLLAASLLNAHVPKVYANRSGSLRVWLKQLPEEVILEQPALRIARARIEIEQTSELERNQLALMIIEVKAFCQRTNDRTLSAMAFELEGYIAHLVGDLENALSCYQQALEVVPNQEMLLRSVLLTGHGMCCTNAGRYDQAIGVFGKAQSYCQKLGLVETEKLIESALAMIFQFKGDLFLAEQKAKRVIEFHQHSDSWTEANAYLFHGVILKEWNRLDQAFDEVSHALKIVKQGWEEPFWYNFYFAMGKILWAQAKKTQALYVLSQALESTHKMGNLNEIRNIEAVIARCYVSDKESSKTDEWFQKTKSVGLEKLFFEEIVSLVRIYLYQKKYTKAQKIVHHAFSRYHEPSDLLQLHIFSASISYSRGHLSKALFHLEQIIPIAQNGGYVRIFLDEGWGMCELFKQVTVQPQHQTYIRKILQEFEKESVLLSLPNLLSNREFEIFRLLQQGNTNKDMARQLDLAIPTIKMHVSSIYRKLGVKNRLQAVSISQRQKRQFC